MVRIIAALAAFALAVAPAAAAEGAGEYEVKAAFLYNFARFVQWPNEKASQPLSVCILGRDPFGSVLEQTLANKTVRERAMEVRHPGSAEEARACEILFISPSEDDRLGEILDAVVDAEVLTVGESHRFVRFGGMIRFRIEDDRVRFDVNPGAVRRAGLRVSSQLLKVATLVAENGTAR